MHSFIRITTVFFILIGMTACHTLDPGACVMEGGRWLPTYKECEEVSQKWCDENKGKFKSCESVCRHAPVPGPCVMKCVQVCKF